MCGGTDNLQGIKLGEQHKPDTGFKGKLAIITTPVMMRETMLVLLALPCH
ncbi:hypothetical protein KAM333_18770 [Aeromonas caviae]|nr:hypothetical protein KAM333_18770 [Aeromonas caviae]